MQEAANAEDGLKARCHRVALASMVLDHCVLTPPVSLLWRTKQNTNALEQAIGFPYSTPSDIMLIRPLQCAPEASSHQNFAACQRVRSRAFGSTTRRMGLGPISTFGNSGVARNC